VRSGGAGVSASSRTDAAALDRHDPLLPFRDRFLLPPGIRYFDGNSLGALAKGVAERVHEVIAREWGETLIGGWNAGWIDLPRRVATRLAPFLGVAPEDVAIADATTVNLFKLAGAVLAGRPARERILAPAGNFPSDLYALRGLADTFDAELATVPAADLAQAVDARTALVTLSHVDFRTGELFDLEALAQAAHAHGALLLADLSHSVGAVPLALDDWGVDLAVGCGYKFLGGGPGAPAFVYARRALADELLPPLRGWLGHADPFAFEPEWRPAAGVERFVCGTPPILSLAALDAALAAWEGIDLAVTRSWSLSLGDLFVALAGRELGSRGFTVASPREGAHRGAQVSLRHAEGFALVRALAARGVVGDFRPPDVLRFGLHPLYLCHADVAELVRLLAEIHDSGAHREPAFARAAPVP